MLKLVVKLMEIFMQINYIFWEQLVIKGKLSYKSIIEEGAEVEGNFSQKKTALKTNKDTDKKI